MRLILLLWGDFYFETLREKNVLRDADVFHARAELTSLQPRLPKPACREERETQMVMSESKSKDAVPNGAAHSTSTEPHVARPNIGNRVTVVLGAQWGDEGKGKVVDLLAQDADIVCRCQVNDHVC